LQTRAIAACVEKSHRHLLIARRRRSGAARVIADGRSAMGSALRGKRQGGSARCAPAPSVLAALRLIDGRRVATHWEACGGAGGEISEADRRSGALYVVDGKVWTSAGVTTGIDMALAMVEADSRCRYCQRHRAALGALRPASGYQSNSVRWLDARIRAESPFADLSPGCRTSGSAA